jgi:hypothetical protein
MRSWVQRASQGSSGLFMRARGCCMAQRQAPGAVRRRAARVPRMPVPAQMWAGVSPSPGVDVGGGEPQSRRRCGRGEPSPGADVGGVSPVPAQVDVGPLVYHEYQVKLDPEWLQAGSALRCVPVGGRTDSRRRVIPTRREPEVGCDRRGANVVATQRRHARGAACAGFPGRTGLTPTRICTGAGLIPPTSALGLGSPLPHLRWD